MLTHLTEPTNIKVKLLKETNAYRCPECRITFAAAPKFCWFCGAQFTNLSECTEVFVRKEEDK